jgi:tRNA nucleotidyltransferase (CCA-adding enzyme)
MQGERRFEPKEIKEEAKIYQGLGPEQYIKKYKEAGYNEQAKTFRLVLEVGEAVGREGGRGLLVGGCVRDEILGIPSKDFDLEIYSVGVEKLSKLLKKMGRVDEVGKSFGILKLFKGDLDIDISIPRRESKTVAGHRGFKVTGDPGMSIKEAARRRDFTMNSICKDPFTGEIFDYFGGVEDLQKRVMRVTDAERFCDDPLRVLRGIQFMGRFGLRLENETAEVMRRLVPDLKELSRERIAEEWKKLLLKSPKPSIGLAAAMQLGVYHELHSDLPELAKTPQDPEWHPEGDVWMHTMMVVDEAAKIIRRENIDEQTAQVVMLASLCHDLGKLSTTARSKGGRVVSPGHEEAGEKPTKKFLKDLGVAKNIQDKVVPLVQNHIKPTMLFVDSEERGIKISDGAIRTLAERISPATVRELVLVGEADHMGRGPYMDPEVPEQLLLGPLYPAGPWLLRRARKVEVEDSRPAPLLMGRDLIFLGLEPGVDFGKIIDLGNRLRDKKDFTKEDVLSLIFEAQGTKEAIEILKQELGR